MKRRSALGTSRQTTRLKAVGTSTALLLPLILAAAYLNMGQSDCGGGDNTPTCQGKPVTHSFTTSGVATWGDDVILVLENDVAIDARDGDDTVCVLGGLTGVIVFAGKGNDELHASSGGSTFYGEEGNDTLIGGTGNDYLYGNDGDDVIEGGDGNDWIDGGNHDDLLKGGAGGDNILGRDGVDNIQGGDGDDNLVGEGGNDFILGGAGDDLINGGEGGNIMFAEEGNDILYAGDEGSTLDGGLGFDVAYPCWLDGTGISGVESVQYDGHCPIESQGVLSARLEIWMCNSVSDAESYGALMISLNGEQEEKRFIGDYPSSPWFPSGSRHVYDFLIGGELNDIQSISIRSQANNDPFCISRLRLGVNHFTEGTAARRWLFDTGPIQKQVQAGATLTYSFAELRSDTDWRQANFMPLYEIFGNEGINNTGLDYETLERLVKGVVEEGIRGNGRIAWDNADVDELVSAEQGYGDDVGPSTADACNDNQNQATCELDWADFDEVCTVYPDLWVCETCSIPGACNWEEGTWPINPCTWRQGSCRFPNHADIHVHLQKARFEARDEIDVSLVLKTVCQDNTLLVEPDKFHVDAQGLFGGYFAEIVVLQEIGGVAAAIKQMLELPEPLDCGDIDPQFDECGFWLGLWSDPRPDPDSPDPDNPEPHIPGDRCQ